MDPIVAVGRTPPRAARSTGPHHRRRVEALAAAVPELARFDQGSARPGSAPSIVFPSGPLPAIQLPDGSVPYVDDDGDVLDWVAADLELADLGDPAVAALCREVDHVRPDYGVISLLLRPEALPDGLTVAFTADLAGGACRFEVTVDFRAAPGHPAGLSEALRVLHLDRSLPPEARTPKARRPDGEPRSVMLIGTPGGADLPAEVAARWRAFRGPGGHPGEGLSIHLSQSGPGYGRSRGRLNAVTGRWSLGIEARYRDDFDPYEPNQAPPPGDPFRFPLASLARPGRDASEPALHVDVVHDRDGSLLELRSVEGKAALLRYAALAGIDDLEV